MLLTVFSLTSRSGSVEELECSHVLGVKLDRNGKQYSTLDFARDLEISRFQIYEQRTDGRDLNFKFRHVINSCHHVIFGLWASPSFESFTRIREWDGVSISAEMNSAGQCWGVVQAWTIITLMLALQLNQMDTCSQLGNFLPARGHPGYPDMAGDSRVEDNSSSH